MTANKKKNIPLYDDTAPIACTITSDEIPGRVEIIERMRANLEHLERTEHGLLLHFPVRPDIEADLHRFASTKSVAASSGALTSPGTTT